MHHTMTASPIPRKSNPSIAAELQRIFGYSEFRPPQKEIVQCLLNRQDALVVMPTGGGKSICFQLPALVRSGLTLVVSPLVALMENQVQELRDRNLSAALLHSELPKSQKQKVLWALEQQRLRLLYVSPETLFSSAIWERLCMPNLAINALVLDEAHCLVQWGETFRPAYYRLGTVRPELLKYKPAGSQIAIAAFTATADPEAQQTIQQILQLNNPHCFRQTPYRPNLQLKVQQVWSARQRRQQLLQFIRQQKGQAGLVYVRTRKDSEMLAEWLTQQGFQTAPYHAGLIPVERRQIEQQWLNGSLQFVVCTNAFGLGINKPNTRWVIHFHAPTLLAEYVQEIGRAGRDGLPAIALTLISEPTGWLDPEDKQRRQYFTGQTQKQYRLAQELIHKLPPQGEVRQVSRQFPNGAIALSLLHSVGALDWLDPFHYQIKPQAKLHQVGRSQLHATQQMTTYLNTRTCRWQFLLQAFGFQDQEFRCGHCDRCDR